MNCVPLDQFYEALQIILAFKIGLCNVINSILVNDYKSIRIHKTKKENVYLEGMHSKETKTKKKTKNLIATTNIIKFYLQEKAFLPQCFFHS